jgi:hypothetical protein
MIASVTKSRECYGLLKSAQNYYTKGSRYITVALESNSKGDTFKDVKPVELSAKRNE